MDEYNLIERVGKGSYGEVWRAELGGKVIALKIVNVGDDKVKEIALREVRLLKQLSNPFCHPSLACLYDYKVEGDKLYIEMEFIEGHTLTRFAKSYRLQNRELKLYKLLIAVIYDICKGLEYMHEKGIIHRDIKPDNIMIDLNNNPKLIDIGLSCTTFDANGKQEMCRVEYTSKEKVPCCLGSAGTPRYQAPEVLLDSVAYFPSDIFSLGASIYVVATGTELFPQVNNMPQLLRATEFDPYPLLSTENLVLNSLVNNMILKDPLKRLTAQQIISSIDS